MSFGTSIGDVILLTQLAWKTVTNTRKACGEYDDLTQQVLGLHVVLSRLQQEVEKPESLFQRRDSWKEELGSIATGCHKALGLLNQVLDKYNALSEREKSRKKLWQQIRFGNGQIMNITELRGKLTYYSSAMSLVLNMMLTGSMGRVEKQMNEAGCDLREIKLSVNGIAAHLMAQRCHEGSVLTAYAEDDRAFWKEFRRELVKDGFSSSMLRKHKATIKAYVTELGSRGVFDEGQEGAHVDGINGCDVKSDLDPEAIDCDQRERKRDIKQKWTKESTPDREGFEEQNFKQDEGDSEVKLLDGPEWIHDGNQEPAKTTPGCANTEEQEVKKRIDNKGGGLGHRTYNDAEGSDHLSGTDYEDNPEDKISLSSQARAPVMDQGPTIGDAKFLASPTGEIKLADSSELDKFHEIKREYDFEYRYRCYSLIADAYDEDGKDNSDRAALSETIMQEIVLKLDALDARGKDQLRTLRRDLLSEVQEVLFDLDDAAKNKDALVKSFDRYWHVYYEEIAPECIKWAKTDASQIWASVEGSKKRVRVKAIEEERYKMAKSKCLRHLDTIESHRNVRLVVHRISFDNLVEDIKMLLHAMYLVSPFDCGSQYQSDTWTWSDASSHSKGTRIVVELDFDSRAITSRSGTMCQESYPCQLRSGRTVSPPPKPRPPHPSYTYYISPQYESPITLPK